MGQRLRSPKIANEKAIPSGAHQKVTLVARRNTCVGLAAEIALFEGVVPRSRSHQNDGGPWPDELTVVRSSAALSA